MYRPIEKRYQDDHCWGNRGDFFRLGARVGSDQPGMGPFKWLFVGLPTGIAFLAAPRWGGIYNVPRKLRDDPATTPPQAAPKQDSSTSGSGLLLLEEKAFGPELRRSQTRRSLLREKLLADLAPRSVHAHRSGID